MAALTVDLNCLLKKGDSLMINHNQIGRVMKYVIILLISLFVSSANYSFAEELIVLEGAVDFISKDSIVIGTERYFIVTEKMAIENPKLIETEYWQGDKERHQTNFKTIYGVGHIDLAKIAIADSYVREIDIITLMQ